MRPQVIQNTAARFGFFTPGVWLRIGTVAFKAAIKLVDVSQQLLVYNGLHRAEVGYITPVVKGTDDAAGVVRKLYQFSRIGARDGKWFFQHHMFPGQYGSF